MGFFGWFENSVEDILAPLTKIEEKLERFVEKTEAEIQEHFEVETRAVLKQIDLKAVKTDAENALTSFRKLFN